MKRLELIDIETLEKNMNGAEKHTPYSAEIRLFSCVQLGDTEKLLSEIEKIIPSLTTGRLSSDSLMQYKYLAVSIVTLATRYAIQGGLSQSLAYSFSDSVIMQVDTLTSRQEIVIFISQEILHLTEMVKNCKQEPIQSPHVRRAMQFINENLFRRLSVSLVSEQCKISPDYLSQIFKEETGENLSNYINFKKVEKAKELLLQGQSSNQVSKALCFSSQSHFSTVFRRCLNMTPTDFINLSK